MEPELAALAAAHDAALAEINRGGFRAPKGAHWDARTVTAHLLVNERLIYAVTNALMRGEPADYDNAPSQDAFVLRQTILEARHKRGLVESLAHAFAANLRSFVDLQPSRRRTLVPIRVWHEGERVVDDPREWWSFAVVASARVHIPAHIRQLRDLRRDTR